MLNKNIEELLNEERLLIEKEISELDDFNKTPIIEYNSRKKSYRKILIPLVAIMLISSIAFGETILIQFGWYKPFSVEYEKIIENSGDRLEGFEVIDNNVRVEITGIVADDLNTYLYYEIEDINHVDSFQIGVNTENYNIANINELFPNWLEENKNFGEFNPSNGEKPIIDDEIFYLSKGILALEAVEIESGVIKLDIKNLHNKKGGLYSGNWSFEIPFEKESSLKYIVDKDYSFSIPNTENEYNIHIISITFGKTNTEIEYMDDSDRQDIVDEFQFVEPIFESFKINGEEIMKEFLSGDYNYEDYELVSKTINFSPIEMKKFKTLEIDMYGFNLSKRVHKFYTITKFPQTFEFMGHDLTIDKLDEGYYLKDPYDKNREYESLHLYFNTRNARFLPCNVYWDSVMEKDGEFVKVADFGMIINNPDKAKYTIGYKITPLEDYKDIEIGRVHIETVHYKELIHNRIKYTNR